MGLGKTVVALLVIAEVLNRKKGKVLFLAPTKPLVEQHAAFLGQNLLNNKIALMTGEKKPKERQELWASNEVIVSTPQVIANDLKKTRGLT
jgi:ERCC4-related helicase